MILRHADGLAAVYRQLADLDYHGMKRADSEAPAEAMRVTGCAVTVPSNVAATLHTIMAAFKGREPLLQPLEPSTTQRTKVSLHPTSGKALALML